MLPEDITQVDAEIEADGTIVLIGHTKSDDKTYTANVQPEWWLDGEKIDKPHAKVIGMFANSAATPAVRKT
ncbi:hypothetical protein AUC71_02405 [Methyloceanibacter marginalis]|uniref:Uncharacterized protein n=1 Tax=Methyloceanibacter marginalis TaxID=1774971 RepID=A0A1E3W8D9_9HYPH|nr:hypothetical protein [Methyloceanibacter marginalis]ODS02079.1 hypothetical protein AUC71_02405 [Methyloceanibacter marginalis]